MGLIRFYLAISVAIWHLSDRIEAPTNGYTINGYLAVISFYIISGYYMSMVLNETYRGPGSTFRFYTARYLRLFPTYAVIAVLSIAFYFQLEPAALRMPAFAAAPIVWLFTVFANTSIFGLDVLRLISLPQFQFADIGVHVVRLVGPAWSLGIELLFYVAAPFIVRRSLTVSVAVLGVFFAVRLSLLPFEYNPWRYYFAPSVMCFFLLGHVSYRLGTLSKNEVQKKRFGLIFLLVLPFLGYFTRIHLTRDIDQPETWLFLLVFAAAIPFIFSLTKSSIANSALGNLSYPLYLVHSLVFAAIVALLGGKEGALELGYGWAALALGLAIGFAILLHEVVELPVEKVRRWVKGGVSTPVEIAPVATPAAVYGSVVALQHRCNSQK